VTETPAARKPQKDGAASRERILDRAEELFATDGLNVSLHGTEDDLRGPSLLLDDPLERVMGYLHALGIGRA